MLRFIEWVMLAAPEVSIRYSSYPQILNFRTLFESKMKDDEVQFVEIMNWLYRDMMQKLIDAGKFPGMEAEAEQALNINYGKILLRAGATAKGRRLRGSDVDEFSQAAAMEMHRLIWAPLGIVKRGRDNVVEGGVTWPELMKEKKNAGNIEAILAGYAKYTANNAFSHDKKDRSELGMVHQSTLDRDRTTTTGNIVDPMDRRGSGGEDEPEIVGAQQKVWMQEAIAVLRSWLESGGNPIKGGALKAKDIKQINQAIQLIPYVFGEPGSRLDMKPAIIAATQGGNNPDLAYLIEPPPEGARQDPLASSRSEIMWWIKRAMEAVGEERLGDQEKGRFMPNTQSGEQARERNRAAIAAARRQGDIEDEEAIRSRAASMAPPRPRPTTPGGPPTTEWRRLYKV